MRVAHIKVRLRCSTLGADLYITSCLVGGAAPSLHFCVIAKR